MDEWKRIYSLGFGSVRSEDKDSITLNRDKAGDQFCFKMSMQMFPCSEICIEILRVMAIIVAKTYVHVVYSKNDQARLLISRYWINSRIPTHRVLNNALGAVNLT